MTVDRSAEYLRQAAVDCVVLFSWMQLKELGGHKASFRIPVAPKSTRTRQLSVQVIQS